MPICPVMLGVHGVEIECPDDCRFHELSSMAAKLVELVTEEVLAKCLQYQAGLK